MAKTTAQKKAPRKKAAKPPKNRVAIIAGCRTPFVRAFKEYNGLSPLELSRLAAAELMRRIEMDPKDFDNVFWGTTIPIMRFPNLGREVAIALGNYDAPGQTVMRACSSGSQSLTSGAEHIMMGYSSCALVGGADSISFAPVPYSKKVIDPLQDFGRAKSMGKKLEALRKVPLSGLIPTPPSLTEFSTGYTMGQHGEMMAKINGITREAQDDYAWLTHKRAGEATDDGRLPAELVPVYLPPKFEKVITFDTMIRKNPDRDSLKRLKPVFDRKYGTLTAGNSSPLTDGAAALLIMSEERAKAEGRVPLGYLKAYAYVGIDPFEQLLLGPSYSTPLALDRAHLKLDDMEVIDMHEAFAVQILSNIQKLESEEFAQTKLNRKEPVGKIDMEKFNILGGSVAVGHPFGATGTRQVITALNELNRRKGQYAMVSQCAGGAMGSTLIFERE
ncbi:acetyl-CoA C-acyltransferase [candidate division CSSED10-310 bacterium]|uniref:Acetyl-CoA C-acyltransferase n=1 Tax=candidate division CSSED10-310 bacterium TaxID=2855610 RepID=A0ABV6YY75_UNCC1